MSLKEFREKFLDQLLRFLWRQWSTLGVLGQSDTEDEWAIDPEALLIFSLQIARYEPRLFDEILSWTIKNGRWLDASRMRAILHGQDFQVAQVVGASIQLAMHRSKTQKWKNLAEFCWEIFKQQSPVGTIAPLFMEKSGEPYPLFQGKDIDLDFSRFALNRAIVKNLKEARDVPVNSNTNVRFLLRSLFGVGSRAEILLYLLTHEGGHPRDVAESIGLFWLGVQQTLSDMAESGLVLKRTKGKRVEYWVSHKRWWDFLSFSGEDVSARPKWLNWMAIFPALGAVWKNVDELARTERSDYLTSSKLLDSLETLNREFSRAGLDVPAIPHIAVPPDLFQKTTLQFLDKALK